MSSLGPRPLLGTTVHLISDNPDLREVLTAILDFCGATVLVSPSAARGRDLVEHGQKPAAMVVDTCTVGLDAVFWTWANDHGFPLVAFTIRESDPRTEPTWLERFPPLDLSRWTPRSSATNCTRPCSIGRPNESGLTVQSGRRGCDGIAISLCSRTDGSVHGPWMIHRPFVLVALRVAEPAIPIDERRARIRRWSSFRRLQQIVGGVSEGDARCSICEQPIEVGQTDFIITFKGAVSLRLDQACMDLWRQESEQPRPDTS